MSAAQIVLKLLERDCRRPDLICCKSWKPKALLMCCSLGNKSPWPPRRDVEAPGLQNRCDLLGQLGDALVTSQANPLSEHWWASWAKISRQLALKNKDVLGYFTGCCTLNNSENVRHGSPRASLLEAFWNKSVIKHVHPTCASISTFLRGSSGLWALITGSLKELEWCLWLL